MSCRFVKIPDLGVMTCTAYPAGIPDDIALGRSDHAVLRGDEKNPVHYELVGEWRAFMRDAFRSRLANTEHPRGQEKHFPGDDEG